MPGWDLFHQLKAVPRVLRHEGVRGVIRGGWRWLRGDGYSRWVQAQRLTAADESLIRQHIATFAQRPLISVIVPVYNPRPAWLRACVDSVLAQLYPQWELCIADDASTTPHVRTILQEYAAGDPRIKVVYRAENGHISAATNSALALATGEFVAFLDHDDLLAPHALYMVAALLNEHADADLIYSDHDRCNHARRRWAPQFKPGWSPDLLRSFNYINHLTVLRTDLARAVGGLRTGLEGAQDHDLVLRTTAQTAAERIHHIPHVLYTWRRHRASVSRSAQARAQTRTASHRAVAECVNRSYPGAEVLDVAGPRFDHRVRYPLSNPAPLVSVVIPTRDRLDLLRPCLEGLRRATVYPAVEIIVVDNGSREPATLAYLADLAHLPQCHVLHRQEPFNYAALNNAGADLARGNVLCFLNDDIVVSQADWLRELVSHALRSEVGAVGPLLRYPDGRVQHGGVVLGEGGVARLAYHQAPGQAPPPDDQLYQIRNVSALTGACLVMRRAVFAQVGGFDENLPVAYNDIDLCLKVRQAGYWLVFTPYAELVHIHSASRGSDETPEKRDRLEREGDYLRAKWGERAASDPFLNPNTVWRGAQVEPAFPSRAVRPWQIDKA